MFVGETVLSIFLRLFNFGVLIAFIAYYCRRYLLVPLREKIILQKQALRALRKQKEDLVQESESLRIRAQEQDRYRAYLREKLARWNAESSKALEQEYKEMERIRALLIKKVAIQEQTIALSRTIQQTMPAVLKDITTDLKKKFSHDKEGRAYNDSLVTLLERNRS